MLPGLVPLVQQAGELVGPVTMFGERIRQYIAYLLSDEGLAVFGRGWMPRGSSRYNVEAPRRRT